MGYHALNGRRYTHLTNSDLSLNEWYEMLGRTDTEFTMNTYMHVTDSMQENVANTMGNLLGGNVANS